MVYMDAKKTSYFVVVAAWLAVFCLFGYRSTFAILAGPMSQTMGWTGAPGIVRLFADDEHLCHYSVL